MENSDYLKVLREKVLSDCRPDWTFWMCDGKVVRNIYELADAIEHMREWTFQYHVNEDNHKNDFAKWITEVLEDRELGHKLNKVHEKKTYARIVRDRILELESA